MPHNCCAGELMSIGEDPDLPRFLYGRRIDRRLDVHGFVVREFFFDKNYTALQYVYYSVCKLVLIRSHSRAHVHTR